MRIKTQKKLWCIETVENSQLNDFGLWDVWNDSATSTYFFIQCVSQEIWLLNANTLFHDLV